MWRRVIRIHSKWRSFHGNVIQLEFVGVLSIYYNLWYKTAVFHDITYLFKLVLGYKPGYYSSLWKLQIQLKPTSICRWFQSFWWKGTVVKMILTLSIIHFTEYIETSNIYILPYCDLLVFILHRSSPSMPKRLDQVQNGLLKFIK